MKGKNKNKMKRGEVAKHDHPGRPRYEMKFPSSAEWTFTDLMRVNGVCTDKGSKNFGKGDKCTMLTLRKNLKHDMFRKDGGRKATSLVVEVKGVTAEPDSESGLGRRATVYRLRAVPAKDHSAEKAPRKVAKISTAPKITTAAETIEAAKAILAEPAAVVTIAPAPEVTPAPAIVPVATVPTVDTAPVADAAPVAPAPVVEISLANETPAVSEVAAPVTAEPAPVAS